MKIRKLKNMTEHSIPVQISKDTTIFIGGNQEIANTEVLNLAAIKPMVAVEYDLSEVNPVKESRVKLYD